MVGTDHFDRRERLVSLVFRRLVGTLKPDVVDVHDVAVEAILQTKRFLQELNDTCRTRAEDIRTAARGTGVAEVRSASAHVEVFETDGDGDEESLDGTAASAEALPHWTSRTLLATAETEETDACSSSSGAAGTLWPSPRIFVGSFAASTRRMRKGGGFFVSSCGSPALPPLRKLSPSDIVAGGHCRLGDRNGDATVDPSAGNTTYDLAARELASSTSGTTTGGGTSGPPPAVISVVGVKPRGDLSASDMIIVEGEIVKPKLIAKRRLHCKK